MKHSRGFTLVELMVVIALVGIIAAFAVPSYRNIVQNNQIVATTNGLVGALSYARNEAIKRGSNVIATALVPTVTGNQWGGGYAIWFDSNGNGSRDTGEDLRIESSPGNDLTIANSVTSVTFRGTGFVTATSTVTFTICDSRTGESGRSIEILASGRIRTATVTCS